MASGSCTEVPRKFLLSLFHRRLTCSKGRIMKHVENVSFVRDFESRYMKPMKMDFKLNGVAHSYDLVTHHNAVSILLYHKEFKKFLVVRQFRPAVFAGNVMRKPENKGKSLEEVDWPSYDAEMGYTTELCAGLVDKDLEIEEVASEEILEECGYSVSPKDLTHVASYIVDADESGNNIQVFYAEIEEKQKVTEGGGNFHEGEQITKVWLSLEEAKRLAIEHVEEANVPAGAMFALLWWFTRDKIVPSNAHDYEWFPKDVLKLTDIQFTKNHKSNRYHPARMFFTLGSLTKSWDMALAGDTVAVFVYDETNKEVILVQRFRPAIMVRRTWQIVQRKDVDHNEIDWPTADPNQAYDLELCGTHVLESGKEEAQALDCIKKKIGYSVSSVKFVRKFVAGISQSGDYQYVYFAKVTDADKISNWTQFDDTIPTRIPITKLKSLLQQKHPVSPPNVLYMIQWFFATERVM